MNQAEEDALKALVDKMAQESGYGGIGMDTMYGEFAFDVARAAVAAERERCAKVCDKLGKLKSASAEECAAAIRRGEE